MKKRSEAKPKKTAAAERTAPMKYDDPEARVLCGICDEHNKVKDCSRDENNVLECPACGAPIETMALRGDLPSKALLTDVKDEEGDALPPTHDGAFKTNPFESKRESAKQDAMLKDFVIPRNQASETASYFDVSTTPVHEPPPKTYCGECGAEWSVVGGKLWPNCGHTTTAPNVDSPTKARNYNPPAGTPRATVLGTTLHITRGKATFPTVPYGSFHVGPFSASVELMPGMNIVETASKIRADLKKIADDAFVEELAWYEQKLGVVEGE